jgi:UDP-N-acetylmuramyl pentapeptide phosphotransferase/UDP-N-acetylglucosamine-1-phosphate transferase
VRVDLAAPAIAFGVTFLVVWCLTRSRLARIVLDQPNHRSLHQTAIPRTGGLGLHLGVLIAWLYTGVPWTWLVLLSYVALIGVSIIDDLRDLPAAARLLAHLIASLVVAAALLADQWGLLFAGVVTLAMAWVTNLYNFMDGADGMAGGMAVSGFLAYGAAASFDGLTPLSILNFSIAASALAFLAFNFSPAKIFMGDAGSIPLGFLAASLGLVGWHGSVWPWWFPAAVFAPFLADATVTLLRRLFAGQRVWQAHREHAYQKLVLMGWSHRRMALWAYVLMLACGGLALLGSRLGSAAQAAVVSLVVLACAAVLLRVEQAWRRHQNSVSA